MASGDNYRARAHECVKAADGVADPERKLVLLDLAQRWLGVAGQADTIAERKRASGRRVTGSPAPEGRHPVRCRGHSFVFHKFPGTLDPRLTYVAVGRRCSNMSGDRSRERRQLAAECLAAAKKTSDVQVRASLVEMAQKWLDLAERCEHDAWNTNLRLRALQAAIGEELRAQYELPQELPHRILTLLMQLNEGNENGSRKSGVS
jgi:hypothetical protein